MPKSPKMDILVCLAVHGVLSIFSSTGEQHTNSCYSLYPLGGNITVVTGGGLVQTTGGGGLQAVQADGTPAGIVQGQIQIVAAEPEQHHQQQQQQQHGVQITEGIKTHSNPILYYKIYLWHFPELFALRRSTTKQ